MGNRNDYKKQKIVKFLGQKFCKRRAVGPKTRKFCPTETATFCARLFSSAHLQKIVEFL